MQPVPLQVPLSLTPVPSMVPSLVTPGLSVVATQPTRPRPLLVKGASRYTIGHTLVDEVSAATVTKVSAQVVPLDPTSVRPSTPIILSLPPSPFSLPLSPSLMPRATIPDPACQSQWISTLDSMSSHPSVDQSTLPEIRLAITQGIRLPFLYLPPPCIPQHPFRLPTH